MALTTQRKRTVHHKKIKGAHHRHSKHYLKTYSPYLPLLLIVIVGLAINTVWASRTHVLGASTSLTASQLLRDTNKERLQYNQDSLKLSGKLSAAAQAKANDMAIKNYWAHETPEGDMPWKFISKVGYEYYTAGENLAYGFGNAEDTIAGWMNSREHRTNLLNSDFMEVGFGIATAKNFQDQPDTTIIVAMYAEPSLGLGSAGFASSAAAPQSEIPMRTVSRVQLLTDGQAPWSFALVSVAALLAASWFVFRHLKVWHKVLVQSEEFIVEHRFLDVLIVATAVTGFVLTRASGFIH